MTTVHNVLCSIILTLDISSFSESIVRRINGRSIQSHSDLEWLQPTSFFSLLPHQSSINHRELLFTNYSALPSEILAFKFDSLPCRILYFPVSCMNPTLLRGAYLLPSYLVPTYPHTYYLYSYFLHSCSLLLTLTIVPIPLVAREAGAVVRPNVVCTVRKHVTWSENGRHNILSSHHCHIIIIWSWYFHYINIT